MWPHTIEDDKVWATADSWVRKWKILFFFLPFAELMLWPGIKKTKLEALIFLYPILFGKKETKCWIKSKLEFDCFQSSDLKSYFVVFL